MTTNEKILALVKVLIMDYDEISPSLTAETRESMKVSLLNTFIDRVKKILEEK